MVLSTMGRELLVRELLWGWWGWVPWGQAGGRGRGSTRKKVGRFLPGSHGGGAKAGDRCEQYSGRGI